MRVALICCFALVSLAGCRSKVPGDRIIQDIQYITDTHDLDGANGDVFCFDIYEANKTSGLMFLNNEDLASATCLSIGHMVQPTYAKDRVIDTVCSESSVILLSEMKRRGMDASTAHLSRFCNTPPQNTYK